MAKKKAKESAGAAAGDLEGLPRLSAHPRAQRQIAQSKSGAALVTFVVVLLLSAGSAVPWSDAVGRAIVIGTIAYLVAWAVAIVVWKQIARAELEVARQVVLERRQAAVDAAMQAREAATAGRIG